MSFNYSHKQPAWPSNTTARGLQLNPASGDEGEASEQWNETFSNRVLAQRRHWASNCQKNGDQPQRDHRGADLSIAGLIPNPSLQSALSGLIGVPLHRLREINSGSPQSPPHQKSRGLAPALVVIIALLCLFRDNKESGCGGRGEADRMKRWKTISFSGGTSNLCRAHFINNRARRPARFHALASPPAA